MIETVYGPMDNDYGKHPSMDEILSLSNNQIKEKYPTYYQEMKETAERIYKQLYKSELSGSKP
jgi:hypothetical protein